MKIIAKLLTVVAVLAMSSLAHAQGGKTVQYQEGLHYFEIEGAPASVNGPVQVVEAFSYLCSH